MNVSELSSHRQRHCGRTANASIIAEMAATICVTAFVESDWKKFDRYFKVLKATQSRSNPMPGRVIYLAS
jgi:hypothetical protein